MPQSLQTLQIIYTEQMMNSATLIIQCPDKRGVVLAISQWVFNCGGNIIQSDQYTTDPSGGHFFMRIVFDYDSNTIDKAGLHTSFDPVAQQLAADYAIFFADIKLRMGILVSKQTHCLLELLYRYSSGELNVDIPFIISNHPDCADIAANYSIPFHHLPTSTDTKAQQEQQLLQIAKDNSDFLVLARYMQILSGGLITHYDKDIINIHHSFLPAFVGAAPYMQAYQRGVKIIGATAHFVTEQLDDGPIIEQLIERVTHRDHVNSLRQKGKYIEKQTLTKAVEAYIEHRIIRNGNKTIVF